MNLLYDDEADPYDSPVDAYDAFEMDPRYTVSLTARDMTVQLQPRNFTVTHAS